MSEITREQLAETQQVEEAVDAAIGDRPESIAEKLERLAQAEEKVRQAQADQQRAAGHPDAARAMEQAAGIKKAIERQGDQAKSETRKSLEEALRLAQEKSKAALQLPAGPPDMAAQAKVSQEAAEAPPACTA